MRKDNFEKELPSDYTQVKYLNAKDVKLGVILNLIALLVLIAVMAVAFLLLGFKGDGMNTEIGVAELASFSIAMLVPLVAMVAYIVLHELVHGAAYKALTGERLTFGMSWSCAFCGVPSIYTYRKCALVAVAAPFLLFTLIFIPTLALLYVFSPLYFLIFSFIFGLHLGGCSGDLYVMYLLLVKFKDKRTLMRDTGPEQFFYVPNSD